MLDTTSDDKDLLRFVTKKRIELYDQSGIDYRVNKEIRIETTMLRSELWDFSDAYIVVKGTATVTDPDDGKRNKSIAFKNNAPFIDFISKTNGVKIDNAEDLDVVMPMYNLLEYSKNYKKQQAICGIITDMNQAIFFLLTLNLLNTRQVLQKILTMLMMMQKKLVKMKLKLLFC